MKSKLSKANKENSKAMIYALISTERLREMEKQFTRDLEEVQERVANANKEDKSKYGLLTHSEAGLHHILKVIRKRIKDELPELENPIKYEDIVNFDEVTIEKISEQHKDGVIIHVGKPEELSEKYHEFMENGVNMKVFTSDGGRTEITFKK